MKGILWGGALLTLQGCCGGPLIGVECAGDSLEVSVVDTEGQRVPYQTLVVTRGEEVVSERDCALSQCGATEMLAVAGPTGDYVLTVALSDGTVVEEPYQKLEEQGDRCCGFVDEVTIVVENPPTGV